MSLTELEHYLDKTDAVTQYPQLKEENQQLRHQLKQAQEKISEYERLTARVEGKTVTMKALLQATKAHSLKAHKQEITRQAHEQFTAQAPQLVQKEVERILHLPEDEMPPSLRAQLNQKVRDKTDATLRTPAKWPVWFQELHQQQINQRVQAHLTETFWQSVATQVALAKRDQWPPFLATYTRDVITPFCQQGILRQLPVPTPLQKTCDKCGTANAWNFYPEHVAQLVSVPELRLPCQNPRCRGLVFKHRMGVTLGDLIMDLVGPPSYPSEQGTSQTR